MGHDHFLLRFQAKGFGVDPVALGIGFTSIGGPVYLAIALVMNAWFLKGAWEIWRRDETQAEADGYRVEKTVFRVSLYYLFLHFGALLVEATLKAWGYGGWAWL